MHVGFLVCLVFLRIGAVTLYWLIDHVCFNNSYDDLIPNFQILALPDRMFFGRGEETTHAEASRAAAFITDVIYYRVQNSVLAYASDTDPLAVQIYPESSHRTIIPCRYAALSDSHSDASRRATRSESSQARSK